LADFDLRGAAKEAELVQAQREAADKFEEWWEQRSPGRYRKQSARLLALLDVERRLGFLSDFDRAAIVRQEADALERAEVERAQQALISNCESAKEAFQRQQGVERELFVERRNGCRAQLVACQNVRMECITNRGLVLDSKQQCRAKKRESSFAIMSHSPPQTTGVVKVHHDRTMAPKETPLLPALIPLTTRRFGK
jgi:hypothetical protein